MDRFVSAACFSKSEDDLNIDIVIPWREKATLQRRRCDYNRYYLKQAGVGRVEVITFGGGCSSENITGNGEGKVLRIINFFPLPHSSMKDFFALSEPLTLVTGDQTFNEVMEIYGKIPLYEKMTWKIDLYNSILEKSNPFPSINQVLEGWAINTIEGLKVIGEKTALCFKKNVIENKSKSEVELFHESFITKKHSFEKYIRKEVLRLSAMGKNSDFKGENERIENEIKAIFKVPKFIEEFSKLLLHFLGYARFFISEDQKTTIDFFIKKYEEIDKGIFSEEVLTPIDKALSLYEKFKAKKEISEYEQLEAMKAIKDLPKLLFPMLEKQIKEIVI
jgi:hypothetical protein